MMIRKTIHFSGTVQGVGFRYAAQRLARGFEVTGCVGNLRDGRVELIAEGEPDQIDALVAAIQHAMRSYISETSFRDSAATGEYRGFGISF
jgi:acylphosphatase